MMMMGLHPEQQTQQNGTNQQGQPWMAGGDPHPQYLHQQQYMMRQQQQTFKGQGLDESSMGFMQQQQQQQQQPSLQGENDRL
jgi:hypothetical protein